MSLSGLVRLLGLLGHLLSRGKASSCLLLLRWFDRHRHGHRSTVELRRLLRLLWLRILLRLELLALWSGHKRCSRFSHHLVAVERHGVCCVSRNEGALLVRDELGHWLLLSRVSWFKVRIASLVHQLIIWLRLAELVIESVILLWPNLCCTGRWVEDLGIGRHVKNRWLLSWRRLNWLLRLGWSWRRGLEGRRLEVLDGADYCSEGIVWRLLCKWVTRSSLRCLSRVGCSRLGSCSDRSRLWWSLLGRFRHVALERHRC